MVYCLELLESYGHYLTTAPASTGGPSNHVTGKYRYLVALPTMATIQDQKLNVLERKEQIIYSHNFVVTLATALGQEDLI